MDPDANPTSVVARAWLTPVDPRSRSVLTDLRFQAGSHVFKHQAWPSTDPGTRTIYTGTQATSLLTNIKIWPTQSLDGLTGKEFIYQSQYMKTRRSAYFHKSANTNPRPQGSWLIKETRHHQGKLKSSNDYPEEMDIYQWYDKEFKVILLLKCCEL